MTDQDAYEEQKLTKDQLLRVVPATIKKNVTDEMVDSVNGLLTNPILRETYRDNIVSYASVMKNGQYRLVDYLNAVRYVSFKLVGSSNIEAYTKAFPDRYNRLVTDGMSSKDISAYVAMYNKNKLVQSIMEQSIVPSWVLNQDMYQRALNVQADLMVNATSEKVRSDAANSILTHLKAPEVNKIELDIGVKQDKSIDELRSAVVDLVRAQRDTISSGSATAQNVAHSRIIEGECEEIE